jgi:disulfide bond formation protein DsbB
MRRTASPRPYLFAILVISLAMIAGALAFQYWVGLQPCELCLKERLPWYAAIVLSILFMALMPRRGERPAAVCFALLFLASFLLGLYHVGVEHHLVAGPAVCTGRSLQGLSIEEATRRLFAAPEVRCDVVQWSLLGISLSGWNAIASLALCLYSAARFSRRGRR